MDSAMFYILKSLQIFTSLKDSYEFNITRNLFAAVLARTNRDKEAVKIFEELISYFSSIKNIGMEAYNHMCCAIVYTDMKEFEKAEFHFKKNIELRKSMGDEFNLAVGYFNMAGVFNETGRNAQAKSAYLITREIGIKLNNSVLLYLANAGLGTLANSEKKWDESIDYAKKVLEFGPKTNDNIAGANKLLYEAYENKKDYKKALDYYKIHIAANDSFHSAERLKNSDDLEARYQNKEKQTQIELLNTKNQVQQHETEMQKIMRNAIVIFSVVLIVLGILFFNRFKLKKKIESQQAIITDRNRISADLHDDIGSGLTKITLLSELIKRESAQPEVLTGNEKIADTLKDMSGNLSEIIWTLNSKNDYLDNLFAYMRRYAAEYFEDSAIDLKIKSPSEIPRVHLTGEQRRNIFFVMKEALHNIVKHSDATEVQLNFIIHNNTLAVTVHDNGKGFQNSNGVQSHSGNGLENMRNRMQSINGTFSLENINGTKIILELPL
ncbi:MAG: ATP-binding protein [Bacteroidota bacterium]